MRGLIDTNILISAALSSQGTPFQAFMKAVTYKSLLYMEALHTY